jgi:hypothetical protein
MKLARSIVRHNPAEYSIKIIESKSSDLIADRSSLCGFFAVFTGSTQIEEGIKNGK